MDDSNEDDVLSSLSDAESELANSQSAQYSPETVKKIDAAGNRFLLFAKTRS